MAYRENNGSRYEDPHRARLTNLSAAERGVEERSKAETDKLNFIFNKEDPVATMDPDKVGYAKIKTQVQLDPNTTGDNSIYEFTGEYKFLSPLHKSPVQLPGDPTRTYASIEHALAASKTDDLTVKDSILNEEEPLAAKRLGTKCHAKNNEAYTSWKDGSIAVMKAIVRDKYRRGPQKNRDKLLATGHRPLVYRVDHNDQHWGTVPKKGGSNHYGKILMEIRNELRAGKDLDAWLSSYFDVMPDNKVLWCVEVTRNGARLPESDVNCDGGVIYMGKLAGCEVMAEHPTCSRKHAVLVACNKLGPCIVDLGTANGTKVNGESIPPHTAVSITGKAVIQLAHSSRTFIATLDTNAQENRKNSLYARLATEGEGGGEGGSNSDFEYTAFIANLPYETTTEKSLTNWLLSTNPQITEASILKVNIPKDKGIAFVSFSSSHGLLQCVALDGETFNERNLKIKKANKRASTSNDTSNHINKQQQLQPPTSSKDAAREGGFSQEKRGYCFDFQKGNCSRGDACRFKHEVDPSKQDNSNRGRGGGEERRPRSSSQDRRFNRSRSRERISERNNEKRDRGDYRSRERSRDRRERSRDRRERSRDRSRSPKRGRGRHSSRSRSPRR